MDTVNVSESTTQTLVSQREVPWMKLGRLVDEPLTAGEAAKLGGIDFEVSLRPLFYANPIGQTQPNQGGKLTAIGNRRAVVNDQTGVPLGIVSQDYPILQYREAFDFMDTVGSHYVAAGALYGGRQAFMVVRAPEQLKVLGNQDPHDLYMVLRTSHDGTRAVEVSVMPLRHRCMNQLTLRSFAAGVPHRWAVRHTSTMAEKLAEARTSLAKVGTYAQAFENTAKRLVGMKLNEAVARTVLEEVLPDRPRRGEKIETIITSWHQSEAVGFDFTGWGLLNAVSEHFEWQRDGGSPQSRFIGALQGQTYNALNRVAGRLLGRS